MHGMVLPDDSAGKPYTLEDLNSITITTGAISPAMARHLRDTKHFERQRAINDRNVERLAAEMSRGWFQSGTPIFICQTPDGREFIVNGNHTLEAIHASGVTVPLTMIRRKVRNLEEVAKCYATFDLQRLRTWADTIQATGLSDQLPMARHVVAALSLIQQNFGYQPRDVFLTQSRQLRLGLVPEYVQAAHVLAAALQNAPKAAQRTVRRKAFFAVALYTARYQPAAAAEFWGGMAMDDGLRRDDPRKALLRFAANNTPNAVNSRAPEHARAAAAAWNAAFEGRTLEYCRPMTMKDIRILGTPFHKGAPSE